MIVEKNAASVLKKETNTGDSLSEPLSAEARFRLAWQLFVALEYSVQVADRKVQAVFSVIGFLFAALSLQRNPFGAPAANTAMTYLLGFPLTFRNIALVALIGAFLICIAIALTSALGAIRPRVSLNVRIDRPPPSLFFFGDIGKRDPETYIAEFAGLSYEEAAIQISRQSHTLALILSAKYAYIARAIYALVVSMALWIVLQALRFAF
jgi:hypothetical protein